MHKKFLYLEYYYYKKNLNNLKKLNFGSSRTRENELKLNLKSPRSFQRNVTFSNVAFDWLKPKVMTEM